MKLVFTPEEIIAIVQPRAQRGSTRQSVRGLSALGPARAGDLSFLGNAKYKAEVVGTQASIVLVPADYEGEPATDQLLLVVENPSVGIARICARLEQQLWPKPAPGVHPSAVIASTARIAASATVGPLCIVEDGAVVGERTHVQAQVFVGRNAAIGDDCWLMPGVIVAAECVLKERVRLQPGVVVGSDGFGYEFVAGRHQKVPQVGNVVIEADVEIGANSTLDRARFSTTVIGEGTKIDNLVQIGHNCIIGRHCILCAQVGLAGTTTLEDYVILGGQVGVGGHLTIHKGAKAGGQAGITSDVTAGSYVNGTPALSYMLERRIANLQPKLPELFRRVDALEAQIADSKKASAS
ncbi:MAG TPA: UDP-3-O-(3-hydroxymyristoyl)glucosamine N-acyltransferase [Opitutaceae bacterium]